MNFLCPSCKKIITRDMRKPWNRKGYTKKGYKSYCEGGSKIVYMKRVTK